MNDLMLNLTRLKFPLIEGLMKQTKSDAMIRMWHCHQLRLASHGRGCILLLISNGFEA